MRRGINSLLKIAVDASQGTGGFTLVTLGRLCVCRLVTVRFRTNILASIRQNWQLCSKCANLLNNTLSNTPSLPSSTTFSETTPLEMQESNWATTTYNGDAMDIDSGVPLQAPRRGRHSSNPSSYRASRQRARVTRHVFFIPVSFNVPSPTDLDIIRAVRWSINRISNAGNIYTIAENLDPENRFPHVRIMLGAEHDNRELALLSAVRRLGLMMDMIQDGLGWLHELPYHHLHFQVELVRSRGMRR